MSSNDDLNERLSPNVSSREPLRVPAVPVASILQTGKASAFRRISPHSSPAQNSRISPSSYLQRRDSDLGTMEHSDKTIDYSLHRTTHSEECDSKCSCRSAANNENRTNGHVSRANHKQERTDKCETITSHHTTPTKPKLSFSVEAIMSTKTSPSSSHQNSQHHFDSQHLNSRESSFSSPSSDRHKENYSPATSEASSRESDLTSPPPHPEAQREGFNAEGLLGKAQGALPSHHPFLTTASTGPDGIHWPWLGGHHPAPGPISKFTLNFQVDDIYNSPQINDYLKSLQFASLLPLNIYLEKR